jgi:hypothetical protein
MPDLPRARLTHAIPGRMRLRIDDRRGDIGYFKDVVTALGTLAGIAEVVARPETAGLLVLHRLDPARIAEFARAEGLFDVAEEAVGEGAAVAMEVLLASVGQRLLPLLNGRSLESVAGAGVMLAVAAVQAARGQVAGPALTHIMHAAALLRNEKPS